MRRIKKLDTEQLKSFVLDDEQCAAVVALLVNGVKDTVVESITYVENDYVGRYNSKLDFASEIIHAQGVPEEISGKITNRVTGRIDLVAFAKWLFDGGYNGYWMGDNMYVFHEE